MVLIKFINTKMYLNVNIVIVTLLYILQLTGARVMFSSDLNSIDNNIANSIEDDKKHFNPTNITDSDNDSYADDDYEMECELSEMPPEPDSMCCGVDVSSNNRVVGGSPTLLKQYPWLALIEYEDKTLCGGSLISGFYVLTAGHCVTESSVEDSTPVNVVLGDYDISQDGPDCIQERNGEEICSDGEVRIAIDKIILHEFYNYETLDNDIALIKLAVMAPYTDFIRPICLPALDLTKTYHDDLGLIIAGWGYMRQYKKKSKYFGKISNVKRALQIPYVTLKTCNRTWSVTEYHICAGGLRKQDACNGDSGGPLMFNDDGQYQLAGVVSFGEDQPCGKINVPGVYTNVYRYYGWMMNLIRKV